ncbi:MAG: hypothetical protein ACKVTZ_21845 [Bacteroidia bacterium]
MKKSVFILFFLVFVSSQIAVSQHYFTMSKLMEFTNTASFLEFNKKVKEYGYLFAGSDKEENYTRYNFTKQVKEGTMIYSLGISYSDYDDGKPVIKHLCSFESFERHINSSISLYGFRDIETSTDENVLSVRYENNTYDLSVHTISKKMEYSEETYNTTVAIISKK